jgi:MFS family permease
MIVQEEAAAPPPARSPKRVRRAIAASTVGTALEWYDFYIYGTAAALVFPTLYFPSSNPHVALIASFATFGVGFAARPLGAAIFGHLADKYGRKLTLTLTIAIMGFASVAIGFLPTYQSIGIAAPILLVALRLLQGIGVGGEWGGAVLISMEQDTGGKRRGFFASWTGFGAPLGSVISTTVILVVSSISGDAFAGASLAAGWRWPFYISILLIAVGIFVRLRVEESPEFLAAKRHNKTVKLPLLEVFKRHPREIFVTGMLRAAENGPYYIFAAFILSYGSKELGVSRDLLLLGVTVAAGLTMITVPLMGLISDRRGRKPVIGAGIAVSAVWAFAYFGMLGTHSVAIIFVAVCLSLLPWSLQYGPQPAFIAESFSTSVRASGAGLGYQVGGAVWGGFAPMIAAALLPYSLWLIPCYVVVLSVISAVALRSLPDRTGQPLIDDTVAPTPITH